MVFLLFLVVVYLPTIELKRGYCLGCYHYTELHYPTPEVCECIPIT